MIRKDVEPHVLTILRQKQKGGRKNARRACGGSRSVPVHLYPSCLVFVVGGFVLFFPLFSHKTEEEKKITKKHGSHSVLSYNLTIPFTFEQNTHEDLNMLSSQEIPL